ncbi:Hypothetical protein R9X50_00664200 [Acrodontium crateriforme]|uniref:Arf-GAP domain-containing protein n=1 Tax=Acrodontium crateriforme TaxID=150365 RepID=A0AAQ3M991_9PEZI|nr:Hypothetical protein R9X50_00664200 [Acrodontium crateriforme]
MASAISKRQQARNERNLQDLLRSVPGNDRCADCAAKNPGWASWNLGIFLCVRCASLHRKLGTHVSKVKSLTMDSWTGDQVDNMKKTGNLVSNRQFNPSNVKPDIPIDADEVEAALERYIRQKYEQRALSGGKASPAIRRQNTGSTGTDSYNDEGPPLPPKPTKRFGFGSIRSASATLGRKASDRATRMTPPLSPTFGNDGRYSDPSSPREPNEPSTIFGMRMATVGNNFDDKLSKLRDMGFNDSKKNAEILKSSNGSLNKAIETLVRLGEGSNPISRSHTPGPRTMTPVSMTSSATNGLTIERTRQLEEKRSQTDPWEPKKRAETKEELRLRAATQPLPPLPHQIRSQTSVPNFTSTNPFLNQSQPAQTEQSLENIFQGLQVSKSGPCSETQQYPHQLMTAVPPVPSMPQQNPWHTAPNSPWEVPQQQQAPAPQLRRQSSNPFLRHSQSQTFAPSNPWLQASSQQSSPLVQSPSNPFGNAWSQQQVLQQPMATSPAPIYGAQPEYFAQPQQAQPVQTHVQQNLSPNPWQAQQQQISPESPDVQGQFQQQQFDFMQPQQTGTQQQFQLQQQQQAQQYAQSQFQPQPVRHDKSSIMALYNTPPSFRPLQTLPEDGSAAVSNPGVAPPVQAIPQRSVTMPVNHTGSMNPFGQPTQTGGGARHVSNESIDFVGFNGNGRHSPDAFAGLSARYSGTR